MNYEKKRKRNLFTYFWPYYRSQQWYISVLVVLSSLVSLFFLLHSLLTSPSVQRRFLLRKWTRTDLFLSGFVWELVTPLGMFLADLRPPAIAVPVVLFQLLFFLFEEWLRERTVVFCSSGTVSMIAPIVLSSLSFV